MSNSLKQLMGMSESELITMGAQYGLTFHAGMKRSHMAQQLSQSAASGWMEVNKELMSESPEPDEEHLFGGDASMISDSAHVAQMLHSAGYGNAFHEAMKSGAVHQVDMLNSYMEHLGSNLDDIWMHMPKANPDLPTYSFNSLKEHLRDLATGHQDIMPELHGHYEGDIMKEFSTKHGGLTASYEYLAHMYLDKSKYSDASQYQHDLAQVASRMAIGAGPKFNEIAAASAMGAPTSYIHALPQIGDPAIVGHVAHPRQPMSVAGFPLGAMGGSGSEYSLTASLTGLPQSHEASKAVFNEIRDVTKEIAQVYTSGKSKGYGEGFDKSATGMSPYRNETSERDMILDSATRYTSIEDARSGYDNLFEPSYNAQTIKDILSNTHDKMDAVQIGQNIPKTNYSDQSKYLPAPKQPWNSSSRTQEEIDIANLDSQVEASTPQPDKIQFHNMQQGSQEWHDFRSQYDITGSTVGSYLGHNKYTSPIKEMSDKIGFGGPNIQNADMARGHRLEPIARGRVAQQYGFEIGETGSITNSDYPNMMYSPDGLIGDDAIWEHKAPRKFFDLNDHQDYQDQMQLGMHLSGRSRALFSQTVGNETRSQWIDKDPDWYDNNRLKFESTMARMDAGRQFVSENEGLEPDKLKAGARAAMTGDGIWGFQTNKSGNDLYTAGKRGMSRYSEAAGTESDPFLRIGSAPSSSNPGQPTQAPESNMAQAVKEGILGAQEENKQKQQATGNPVGNPINELGFPVPPESADAEFDSMMNRAKYNRMYSGGGNGGGNGGDGDGTGGGFFEGADPSKMWDSVRRGITNGTMQSMRGGFMNALEQGGPVGQTAALAIGALGVGGDFLSQMSDYRGTAEDYGMTNAVGYDSMNQGMEMLGLNETQARNVNGTLHSAYNMMQNGDPSAAASITVATRGLLTIGDINAAQGDPVALNRIFSERAKQRGWSQAQIAGAAQMAGLDGFARGATRGETVRNAAEGLVDSRNREDVSEFNSSIERGQAARAAASPTYFGPRYVAESGSPMINAAAGTIASAYNGMNTGVQGAQHFGELTREAWHHFIEGAESGHNPTATNNSSSAYGSMQVLSGTRRDPGFGVRPAQNNSPEEAARVGRDYADAMLERYNGDYDKANAAYTEGPGTVDNLVKTYGADWLKHAPAQAQQRVSKFHQSFTGGNASTFQQEGSTGGGSAGTTNVNVTVQATVNQKSASATVSTPAGQTVAQTINLQTGQQQRR